ncbi:hypothetical protein [Virgisporangium aliadipatigenens]|nr:hypothetical protein [Virgisporangium aliadipatigenens]
MKRGVLAVCAVLVVAGCGGFADGDDKPSLGEGPLTASAVPGPPVAFQVRLAKGQRLDPQPADPAGCPGLRTYLASGRYTLVTFEAFAASCQLPRDNDRSGNGRHAWYRSAADAPAGGTKVATPIGEALIFGSGYYECTNSCRNYTDTVAVITLDKPVDSAYAALVVRSDKGSVSLEEMTALVRDRLGA